MVLYFANPPVIDPRTLWGHAAGFHLFLNERDSDVAISVQWEGETWHFPAHRLVLSAMSDVFRRMLETDMLEKSRGRILITDCHPLTLKNFLKFLYTGSCEFADWTDSEDLLSVSHKYGVASLVHLCESHLKTCVSLSNACRLYELSQTYSLALLEKAATELIFDAAYIVTATQGFLQLRPRSLHFFLRSKRLVMENECSVLTSLRDWAIHRCARKGRPLSRSHVLGEMEPFMQHIRWAFIPEPLRTFVPDEYVQLHLASLPGRRKSFHVATSLQPHVHVLKFVVELGAFHGAPLNATHGLKCLRFGVDKHAFVAGFRMIGLFSKNAPNVTGSSSLTLGRDDHRSYAQFNLQSLPWSRGTTVDDHVWQELTAYLPFPVRLDPNANYVITLRHNSQTRWPSTRLDSGCIVTSLGNLNFNCWSECYGITQLFMLPAPPTRNVCNDLDSPC